MVEYNGAYKHGRNENAWGEKFARIVQRQSFASQDDQPKLTDYIDQHVAHMDKKKKKIMDTCFIAVVGFVHCCQIHA